MRSQETTPVLPHKCVYFASLSMIDIMRFYEDYSYVMSCILGYGNIHIHIQHLFANTFAYVYIYICTVKFKF